MFNAHVSPRFGQITRRFAETDTGAWIVGLAAIAILGLIATYMFGFWA